MTTTNLGLSTWDTASGSATTFLTFRLALAGNSSNMTIIDDWVGSASGCIVALQSNVYAAVNANNISGNYFEATTAAVTGYYTNLPINLKLNATVSGSTTLNINSYGVRALKKVSSGGSLVDISSGDLKINNYYPFIYDGTQFVALSSNAVAPVSDISGSGVMSTTTGSVVKHNTSGITSGSYSRVIVDSYGHVTAGSVIEGISGSRTFYSGSASGAVATVLNTVTFVNGIITGWTQA